MFEGEALAGFALLGLAGSMHCVGMCGGFVLGVAGTGPARGRVLSRALVFGFGKALTYAILGLVLARLAGRTMEIVGLQRVFAWIAGGLLIVLGLRGLGRRPARKPLPGTPVARAFGNLMGRVERLGGTAGAFGAGVVTGFMPCGLSWGAFVLATQTTAPTAAVGLFLFGLATTPALAALALGWRLLSIRMRTAGTRVLAVLLIVFGIVTMTRGVALGTTVPPDRGSPSDSGAR